MDIDIEQWPNGEFTGCVTLPGDRRYIFVGASREELIETIEEYFKADRSE